MLHKTIFFPLLITILSGCYAEPLKYKLGIGTFWIEGTVLEQNGNSLDSDSFILIVEYFPRFIQFENESPIYVPRARLAFPNKKGDFRIKFDLKATSIELAFVAEGYKMHRFFFRRQLGVGDLKYDLNLKKSISWKNEFFLQTRPYLERFIIEQRYGMPDSQQMFLGNWLAEIKRLFLKN
tara:strand:+ start:193 stop:732 length:540 start_codon:yes stop_codon:yes gene_type:complete